MPQQTNNEQIESTPRPEQSEKPAASSSFNVTSLLDTFKSTVSKVEQLPSLFTPADALLPKETKPEPLAEGTHKNANGTQFKVDAKGQITEFAGFKNIKYDDKNEILSYLAPSGHTFSRISQTNKDGVGTWMVTDAHGRQCPYAGANGAYRWNGKADVSEKGFNPSVGITDKSALPPVADRVLKQIEASPNPAAELTTALKKMENLRDASVTRLADGRHQVNMHFDHATQMPAINANIRGFRPGPTNVGQHLSFVVSPTANGVRLDNINGLSGSVTGPRGRVRPSWNNGMEIGRDQGGTPYVDIDSTVQGPFRMRASSNRFREGNFPADSPMRQLMHHPDVLGEATNALRLFQNKDEMLQGTLRKGADGRFDVASQSRSAKDIPVNQKLDAAGGMTVNSIHLDSALSGSLSHDSNGAKFGNVKGMTVKVTGLLGEMTVAPKSFELKNNDKGEPVVRLEVDLKGTMVPIEVPVSKLKEYRNRGK